MEHQQNFEHKKNFLKKISEMHKQIDTGLVTENAAVVIQEKMWLEKILDHRIAELKNETSEPFYFSETPPPDLTNEKSYYAYLVNELKLSATERLVLISALMPHLSAGFFTNKLASQKATFKTQFPELGGYMEVSTKTFNPTIQTILYLLSGNDMTNDMLYYLSLMDGILLREQIIAHRSVNTTEDETNRRNHILTLAPEYVNYLLSGEKPRLDFGRAFPAALINTDLEWKDLVLHTNTFEHVQEVMNWLDGSKILNATKKISKGYPCLFYGPPGTGKTLTASLIGKYTGKDVFRIDLSMIVSKYIGETEKNLAHLFERAENKDCILFFDEADSLFSKRTEINSSNDKWANLEVSYLLQKMETYPGLTILATNLKNNLDSAMTRRFQAMVYFGRPKEKERLKLWQLAVPSGFEYAPNVSMEKLSNFDLTGANIANVLKFCCSEALKKKENKITVSDLSKGIRREFTKEGRTP